MMFASPTNMPRAPPNAPKCDRGPCYVSPRIRPPSTVASIATCFKLDRFAIMYSKILVPIDGSDTSLRALGEAAKLAHLCKARIDLHTSSTPPRRSKFGPFPYHATLKLSEPSCCE